MGASTHRRPRPRSGPLPLWCGPAQSAFQLRGPTSTHWPLGSFVLLAALLLSVAVIAVICSLVNHALMFLFSHLSDSSGFKETFNSSRHILEEIVALDRDLSLILSRNHLSEQDTKDVWCNSVDKLASLEQRIIE